MIRLLAFLLALFCAESANSQVLFNGPQLQANRAYGDLLSKFWIGQAATGMWITDDASQGNFALWEIGGATNVLYSYWSQNASSNAGSRITSVWNFVKAKYGSSGLTTCGTGTKANFALDDTASDILFMLESYVITTDANALTYAKGAIDCANARWSDGGVAGCVQGSTPSGGLWYNDTCQQKTVVGEYFAFVEYWYYQLSGDSAYLTKAIALDQFSYQHLQRYPGQAGSTPGQAVTSAPCVGGAPYVDGLYWNEIESDGSISGGNTPCQIAERGSVTSVNYNMSAALLLTRLYADPNVSSGSKAVYLQRIITGTQGMNTFETGCGSGGLQSSPPGCACTAAKAGILFQDRDPHGQSIFFLNYLNEVYPLVSAQSGVLTPLIFTASANLAFANDRNSDATYGGSWSGPAGANNCWGGNEDLSITAAAINLIVAGYAH